MLTKFTLPKEYDSRSPLFRLWLQSRLIPKGWRGRLGPIKFKPPELQDFALEVYLPALESTDDVQPSPGTKFLQFLGLRNYNELPRVAEHEVGDEITLKNLIPLAVLERERPPSLQNLFIWIDILRLLIPRMLKAMVQQEHRFLVVRLIAQLAYKVLEGVLGGSELWTSSQMMNIVESSLRGDQPVSWRKSLHCALQSMILKAVKSTLDRLNNENHHYIRKHVSYYSRRMKLLLDLSQRPSQKEDLLHRHLMSEVEWFGGRTAHGLKQSPFFQALSHAVSLATQLVLLRRSVKQGAKKFGTRGMLGLVFVPVTLRSLATFLPCPEMIRMHFSEYLTSPLSAPSLLWMDRKATSAADLHDIEGMASHSAPNTHLFGLQDWILSKWEEAWAISQSRSNRPHEVFINSMVMQVFDLCFLIMRHFSLGIDTAANILISTKTLPIEGSLSDVHYQQRSIQTVVDTIGSLHYSVAQATSQVFSLAAYMAAGDELGISVGLNRDYENLRTPEQGGMKIELRNLSVSYFGHPAVSDINLDIGQGETLAIVGLNGAGKSTLLKALMGLCVYDGTVAINGVPFSDYNPASLHKRMTSVFQYPEWYKLSLRENITTGSVEHMDNKEVLERAVQLAKADKIWQEYLEYEEKQDPHEPYQRRYRGVYNLSGGEQQRIALARAFMRVDSADLVVFDEPSSALDPGAEAEIFDTILGLSKRPGHCATTIFVSHAFCNVRCADKIAFMDNGRIIEYGSHEDLMVLGGEYCRLFTIQRQRFEKMAAGYSNDAK